MDIAGSGPMAAVELDVPSIGVQLFQLLVSVSSTISERLAIAAGKGAYPSDEA